MQLGRRFDGRQVGGRIMPLLLKIMVTGLEKISKNLRKFSIFLRENSFP